MTCWLNLGDVYLNGIFILFSDNSFLLLVRSRSQWDWGFPEIPSSFLPLHQHFMLSLGGLVMPSLVGLLMVLPLPLLVSRSSPRWDNLPSGHQRNPLLGLILRYMYWGQEYFSENWKYQYMQKKEVHVLMVLFPFSVYSKGIGTLN